MRQIVGKAWMPVAMLLVLMAMHAASAARTPVWSDDFSDASRSQVQENIARIRVCPRVPVMPDARVDKAGIGLFPSILKLPNGNLLVAWHEPKHGVDPKHGRDMVAWSVNGGRTWSDPVLAIDVPGVDDRDPVIRLGPEGRIWLGAAGGHAVYSDDNGRSWSPPLKAGGYPVAVLAGGEFLWTCWGRYPEGFPLRKRKHAYVRGTRLFTGLKDGVIQWGREKILYELGDADEWYLCETSVPGRMVAMLRQQDTGDYYYTSISKDGGASFRKLYKSPIWHSPTQSRPMLMTMADGTVVCSYGERLNNRVMLIASFDHGETWQTHRKLVICDNRPLMDSDHSYPDTAQLDDHALVSAWYARSKVYVNKIDARFFKDVYAGVRLADTGLPLDERTVAHWSFDEKDGIFANEPARYNYGKMAYATRVPGRFGRALRFDGDKAFVQVIDCDVLRVPRYYTLSAWINIEDASRQQTILDKGDPYYLGLEDGKLTFQTADMRYQSKASIPTDKWTHVAAATWVANQYTRVSFFIDGKFDSRHKIGGARSYWDAQRRNDRRVEGEPLYQEYYPPLNQRTDALVIGNGQGPDRRGFLGMMDEVRIHEGDLTAQEIKQLSSQHYQTSGKIMSAPVARPKGTSWATFTADVKTPEGTKIVFSVLDKNGETILADVDPESDISMVRDSPIRLCAELRTSDPQKTPVLSQWAVQCK